MTPTCPYRTTEAGPSAQLQRTLRELLAGIVEALYPPPEPEPEDEQPPEETPCPPPPS